MTLMYPNGCTVIISQPIMGVYNVGVKLEPSCGGARLGPSDSATTMASEGGEARHTFFPIPFYINPHFKPQRPTGAHMPPRKGNSPSFNFLEHKLFKVDRPMSQLTVKAQEEEKKPTRGKTLTVLPIKEASTTLMEEEEDEE